jgi:hypothetical protein
MYLLTEIFFLGFDLTCMFTEAIVFLRNTKIEFVLTPSIIIWYIYIYGVHCKARNFNIVYIYIYIYIYIYGLTFGNAENRLFLFAAQCFNIESMQKVILWHSCV